MTVPGYYGRTNLTDADRKVLAEVPDDEAALKARTGIARAGEGGRDVPGVAPVPVAQRARPRVGERRRRRSRTSFRATRSPSSTSARRSSPTRSSSSTSSESTSRSRAGTSSRRSPTDEERARYPKLARLRRRAVREEAARQPFDSPVGRWAAAAVGACGGGPATPLVRIRMMGGTVPTHAIVGTARAPFVIVPLVNADNNQHSYDENLRMGELPERDADDGGAPDGAVSGVTWDFFEWQRGLGAWRRVLRCENGSHA